MIRILISGSNGLIGHDVASYLTEIDSYQVFNISRSSSSESNHIYVDLSTDWCDDVLPEKIDIVLHLAQSEKFRNFPESVEEVFNVNTLSTIKLLNYARRAGAKKFIYASSGGIYGNGNDEFTEETPINLSSNLGFYLSTKFCSELLVQNYSPFFEIDILRFFFVYGPRQRKDMLIPRLINSVKNGVPITLQGEDGIKINPIYVDDAVEAIIKCFDITGNNRINVAGSEILSLRNICEVIGEAVGKAPVFSIQEVEPKHLIADISRMKEKLTTPSTDFKTAIQKMVQ